MYAPGSFLFTIYQSQCCLLLPLLWFFPPSLFFCLCSVTFAHRPGHGVVQRVPSSPSPSLTQTRSCACSSTCLGPERAPHGLWTPRWGRVCCASPPWYGKKLCPLLPPVPRLCAHSTCTLVLLRYLPPQGLEGMVAIPTSLCPEGQFQCLLWGAGIGLESTFEPLQWLEAIGGTRGASRAITAGPVVRRDLFQRIRANKV